MSTKWWDLRGELPLKSPTTFNMDGWGGGKEGLGRRKGRSTANSKVSGIAISLQLVREQICSKKWPGTSAQYRMAEPREPIQDCRLDLITQYLWRIAIWGCQEAPWEGSVFSDPLLRWDDSFLKDWRCWIQRGANRLQNADYEVLVSEKWSEKRRDDSKTSADSFCDATAAVK